ncbi:MAG: flagellar filament capping protein FliD [Planctomycetota bacterium]|jgi:flagellar capping protein FliD
MSDVAFSGAISGIDSGSIVKSLLTIESRRKANYQLDQKEYETQSSAIDELRAKINGLKSAASSLSDSSSMANFSASSSDKDILEVSAGSDANAGSHSVAVNQLATSETWIQETSSFTYKTDYVGGGVFMYSYNNVERAITTADNETTLEDLVRLINKDEENPGVSASLLYQGGTYHLMLSGQDTGEDYQISINTSSTEVWRPDENAANSTFTANEDNAGLSAKITSLDQFTGDLDGTDTITVSGKNHDGVTLPDTTLAITANTTLGHLIDSINDHFEGTAVARLDNGQIVLTDTTSGASSLEISLSFSSDSGDATLDLPTMTVAEEGGSTAATLTEANAVFDAATFTETQNAKNAKIRIDGFPAGSQDEVQTISITGGTPTTGTFKLSLDGETTGALAYNATAADIQSALESLSGVEAGDVIVSGTNLAAGDITVQFAGNLAETDIDKMSVSDTGTMDAGVITVTETTKGSDGWLHRNSNTISDALSGVTLNLQNTTEPDDPIDITITRSVSSVTQKVQTFVNQYNELLAEVKAKTEYNADTKSMGLLSRDYSITALKHNMRSPFTSIADGFLDSVDAYANAEDIGITLNGRGELEFEASEFNLALEEDYSSVLALLGAAATGTSSNGAVQFYNASDQYTQAGTYHVKVEVDSNQDIISAKIKLAGESEYRNATSWNGNIISFDSTFENGEPAHPEHSLQLTVDLKEGVYGTDANPVVVRVKQGIFGQMEDTLDSMTKVDGLLDTSQEALDDKIELMKDKIENEEARLTKVEARLNAKYARLEMLLAQMQEQQSSIMALMNMG